MLPITVTGCALSFPITMQTLKDGGPAFPINPGTNVFTPNPHGMSLRDWFAGQALMGRAPFTEHGVRYPSDIATECFVLADAMIAARSILPATTTSQSLHV